MPVLDTTFIIDLLRKRPEACQKLKELEEDKAFLATTCMNVLELYRGVYLSSEVEGNLSLIRSILEEIPVLPVTDEVFPVFGEISAQMFRKGIRAGDFDEIIAAVTLCYDGVIVTRENHFTKIPGITVEKY
ncbi:MAG: type II toxin-antitoxin system VapC family toxin [Methanoregulaceae archaeon]|nr:type II toxin-antitoxin system VapC family toxin [Methanoregulaceae archaeon]